MNSVYSSYIHMSKYARWLPDASRRETWPETVDRYVSFIHGLVPDGLDPGEYSRISGAIERLEVMPSMRAMMTAGPALARDNAAAFNCVYVAVDHPRAFDEAVYLTMCGCGVGFSVERQHVRQLPPVPDIYDAPDDVIAVRDSRKSWAASVRKLMAALWAGHCPSWDLSRIRPAGAPLATFGGRSSGPAPLDQLLHHVVLVMKGAQGRQLTSLECHSIMCMIGSVINSGDVRRAAMISLSNPSDDRMRDAKHGEWHMTTPHLAYANNSAVWTDKPDAGRFMDEWTALYRSQSGERGVINRAALREQAGKYGRRDPDHDFGVNPCLVGGTLVDTAEGRIRIDDLAARGDLPFVFSWDGDAALPTLRPASRAWETKRVTELAEVTTDRGLVIRCTPDHKFLTRVGRFSRDGEYVAASDLRVGQHLRGIGRGLSDTVLTSVNDTVASVRIVHLDEPVPVYDLEVPGTNNFSVVCPGQEHGVIVHNCGEIILRSSEMCNLSEVVARPGDTLDDLLDKASIATVLGTIQAALTDFKYIRPVWKKNCEEERLLGVSITGQMDHPVLSGVTAESAVWMAAMRERVVGVNAVWAERLGINPSTATTCQKPSGNVSQLVDASSGGHPRWAKWYLRRTRESKGSPVAAVLVAAGVPYEQDQYSDGNWVFEWPIAAPEGAVTNADMTAVGQMERWLHTRTHWCEHNPSATITIHEDEWMGAGAWVYDHFDSIGGLAFLPFINSYAQPPYQEISREEFERRDAAMPREIDWDAMVEMEDSTSASQDPACVAGHCEL